MSLSHWWFSRLVAAQEAASFAARFQTAYHEALLSHEEAATLRDFEQHPEAYSQGPALTANPAEKARYGQRYNALVWLFNRPGFDALGAEVAETLSEANCCRFVSVSRCTPVALLWYAIGAERAARLPGHFGNVYFHADEVAQMLERTQAVMEGVCMDSALARGLELAGDSNAEERIRKVLTHLGDGLARAAACNKGFLAVARAAL